MIHGLVEAANILEDKCHVKISKNHRIGRFSCQNTGGNLMSNQLLTFLSKGTFACKLSMSSFSKQRSLFCQDTKRSKSIFTSCATAEHPKFQLEKAPKKSQKFHNKLYIRHRFFCHCSQCSVTESSSFCSFFFRIKKTTKKINFQLYGTRRDRKQVRFESVLI